MNASTTADQNKQLKKRAVGNYYMLLAFAGYVALIFAVLPIGKFLKLWVSKDLLDGLTISLWITGILGCIVTVVLGFFSMISVVGLRVRTPLLVWHVEGSQWKGFANMHGGPYGRFLLPGLVGLYIAVLVVTSVVAPKQLPKVAGASSLIFVIAVAFICTFILPYATRSGAVALYDDCAAINGRIRRWGLNTILSVEITPDTNPILKITHELRNRGDIGAVVGEDTKDIPVSADVLQDVLQIMGQLGKNIR